MIQGEEEEHIGTLEESLISFRLSGPNNYLSREEKLNEELANSEDSTVHSPRRNREENLRAKKRGR